MMFDEVKEIISRYTESESITEDLSLTKDLMLTSLDVVSMVGDFEDAFDIEIADEEVMQMKSDMAQLVAELEPQATIHDFRVVKGENRTNLIFDVVVPFSMTDIGRRELVLEIKRVVKEQDPKLECVITVENSYCAK